MSNIIASLAISGAHKLVDRAETAWRKALANYGADQPIGFPNTAYFLPVIYGVTGLKVETLGDVIKCIERCRAMLPTLIKENDTISSLDPALNAGMAALFAEEIIEAVRYLETPHFYTQTEDPTVENLWLGAADDINLRTCC